MTSGFGSSVRKAWCLPASRLLARSRERGLRIFSLASCWLRFRCTAYACD